MKIEARTAARIALLCVGTLLVGAAAPEDQGQGQAPYLFEAANFWGNNYLTLRNAVDPQACAQRCDADARCRVASFQGPRAPAPWANTCVLRHSIGPRHTEQPDIVSWVKPE